MARKKTTAKKASKKKAPTKKAARNQAGPKKPSTKKAAKASKKVAKAAAKKAPAKKTAAKKAPAKKAAAKKAPARKASPKKKAGAKKTAAKKVTAKRASAKESDVEAAEEIVEVKSNLPAPVAPRPGLRAPNFVLRADDGSEVSLSSLKGKKVVLYFYPKDDTPGCTTEACAFRDKHAEFKKRGAVILGVSKDSVKKHESFKKKYKLPFQLLSDENAEVISAFGSWGQKKFMGRTFDGILRTTVLIDEEGKIAKMYPKVSVKDHADEVLQDLDSM